MSTEVARFSRFAVENPVVVSECLRNNFGVDALMGLSREHGFEIGQDDVDECVGIKNTLRPEIRYLVRTSDGALRELTPEELDKVGGGIPISWINIGVSATIAVDSIAVAVSLVVAALGILVFVFE